MSGIAVTFAELDLTRCGCQSALHFVADGLREVLRGADLAVVESEKRRLLRTLLGAQDQADGRLLSRSPLVRVEPAEIEFHLSLVAWFELARLQLDGDQASHSAMEEEQIEVVVLAVDDDALLARDEAEVRTELEQEALHLVEDRALQVRFAVLGVEPEEVENVGVAEREARGGHTTVAKRGDLDLDAADWPARGDGALVELVADLGAQCALRPMLMRAHLKVEVALWLLIDGEEFDDVGPRQLLRQWRNNLRVRILRRELHHA